MAGPYLFELDGTPTELGLTMLIEMRRKARAHCPVPEPPPIVPAGLAPFMTLPGRPEGRTLTRARMAQEIARAMSAEGRVTREDLERAGFTAAEITAHFESAVRVARASRMAT